MQPHGPFNLSIDGTGGEARASRVGLIDDRTGIPVSLLFLRGISNSQQFEFFSANDVETQIHECTDPDDQAAWKMLLPFFEAEGSRLHVVAHPLSKRKTRVLEEMVGTDRGLLRRTGLQVLKSYREKADTAFVPQASTLLSGAEHRLFHQKAFEFLSQDPHFFFIVDFPTTFSTEDVKGWVKKAVCADAAAYYPHLVRRNEIVSAGPVVAAAFQRNDDLLGIHYLPANQVIRGEFAPVLSQTPAQMEELLSHRVNSFQRFAGHDLRVWGGYTLADRMDLDARFISTRRTMIAIRETIHRICEPFVLEPLSTGLEKIIDVALQSAFQPLRKLFDPEVKNPFETEVSISSKKGQDVIHIDVKCRIPYVLGEMKLSLGVAA